MGFVAAVEIVACFAYGLFAAVDLFAVWFIRGRKRPPSSPPFRFCLIGRYAHNAHVGFALIPTPSTYTYTFDITFDLCPLTFDLRYAQESRQQLRAVARHTHDRHHQQRRARHHPRIDRRADPRHV